MWLYVIKPVKSFSNKIRFIKFFKISDCLNQEKRLLNILQDMISVSCSIEHQKYLIGKILSFILSDQSATTSQQNNLTNKLEINFDWGKINIIS